MIKIYGAEWCPFCQKVFAFCKDNHISYEEKNVDNPTFKEELLATGGKGMIPFLVDTESNTMLYDSGEIIDYLRKKFILKK